MPPVAESTEKALVLFSGGQDSTVCLAWALERFGSVETVGFDYGQRHAVELECRHDVTAALRAEFPGWADRLGADHLTDLSVLATLGDTALTREAEIAMGADGLPNTFVPGRNLVFLTIAAAIAYRRDARHIVAGMCETDYSGYPDCRDDTVKAMQTCAQSRHGPAVCPAYPVDVDRQGGNLGDGGRPGRRAVGRSGSRAHPYLLPGRARCPA